MAFKVYLIKFSQYKIRLVLLITKVIRKFLLRTYSGRFLIPGILFWSLKHIVKNRVTNFRVESECSAEILYKFLYDQNVFLGLV